MIEIEIDILFESECISPCTCAVNPFLMWKPLLWFVKGDCLRTSDLVKDLIESQHAAEYLISKLTRENDVVLDPMMGAGATGIAALHLKRHFVGIEKDSDSFQIAEAKIRVLCSEDKITITKK